ncbi:MAG: sodium:calcium antiporter [Deltaproteobacteria bacterium]|nr:sodium:calcium antiporter [Deltaproteobacteria bacterium]
MFYELLVLGFYLVVIVAASEIFTNAIEALGAKLKFSEGVTGSIFAAVGTALPETMVPLVAIFGGNSAHVSEEVGVGAILGAPFMLSTLAMFLVGLSAWKFRKRRPSADVAPERSGFKRDIEFFLFAFILSFLVAFTPHEYRSVRLFVCFVLVLTYFYYVLETVKASADLVKEGHSTESTKNLYLSLIFKEHMGTVLLQLLFALGLIIVGARGFVHGVESLADILHMPIIALSLLIVPVATELPDKINSILWIRNGKDTMATGNITGAMVFQGSLLPAIGIFLTPWTLNTTVLTSGIITIIAALWLYLMAVKFKRLKPFYFILNGACYVSFVLIVLFMLIR